MWQDFFQGLDVVFEVLTSAIHAFIPSIPHSALTYAIGILVYSLMLILTFFTRRHPRALKVVWVLFWIGAALFTLWRLGVLFLLPDDVSVGRGAGEAFALFAVVFMVVMITFAIYHRNQWIPMIVLGFMWGMFLLITWVICPLNGESAVDEGTFGDTLLIFLVFMAGIILVKIQEKKGEESLYRRDRHWRDKQWQKTTKR